jgi:diguanylate cyclase (GGDEF)-like protein
VPILLTGSVLTVATLLAPDVVAPTPWARAGFAAIAVGTVALASWIMRRGLSIVALLVLSVWADAAIVVGSLALRDPTASRSVISMFALVTVAVALYCPASMLAVQSTAVAAAAAVVMAWAHLPPLPAAIQVMSAMLATVSPGVAVLLLRRRLEAALRREREVSLTDPLTRATNRRGLEEALPRLVLQAQVEALPIGLAVIDVDHFKRVNDRYGHLVGDQVLLQVAEEIRECVRVGDVLCRFGGEEFVVLAVISPDMLAGLTERIRDAVERRCAAWGVTVSIGATWVTPAVRELRELRESAETVWTLLDHADELMYRAKREGRNRVLCHAFG